MKLVRFSYKASSWEVSNVYLNQLNLIVGKNSTGKSRFLISVNAFSKMITQTGPVYWGKFDIEFINNSGERINYVVERKSKEDIFEELKVNGNVVLYRDQISSSLQSITSGERANIHPPQNKLVLHVRRDIYEYPHFEQLVKWAENVHSFKFGHIHANSFLSEGLSSADLSNVKNLVEIYRKLNNGNRQLLLKELNEIGFSIKSLFDKGVQDNEIYITEETIDQEIKQTQLSQGMFRSISLLIFLNYLRQDEDVTLLLVDDLCEGLDYERSSKLAKLIFNKLEESKLQLLVTTNDYFLMENIPLKYWSVLTRKRSLVTSISYNTNRKLFEDFKFTGLSNFDFFSSDYIEKYK